MPCRIDARHEHSRRTVLGRRQQGGGGKGAGVHHAVRRWIVVAVLCRDLAATGFADVDHDERHRTGRSRCTVSEDFVGLLPVHRPVADLPVSDEERRCRDHWHDGEHGWRDRACCVECHADLRLAGTAGTGDFRSRDLHGDFACDRADMVGCGGLAKRQATIAVAHDVASGRNASAGFLALQSAGTR